MQTININLNNPSVQNEPRGIARNAFQLGRGFMDNARANQRHPFPEFSRDERALGSQTGSTNLWQSYNATASYITNAQTFIQAAANHLNETALMLTLAQTMINDALSAEDALQRNEISERIDSVLGNIDASYEGLERIYENTRVSGQNQNDDTFTLQVNVNENQMREIDVAQVNTRTLGLGDGSGNIAAPADFDDLRQRVADAISDTRVERANINISDSALRSDRRDLDLANWDDSGMQPVDSSPPPTDDAAVQMQRAEAERTMRMENLRREASNMDNLHDMIELFRV